MGQRLHGLRRHIAALAAYVLTGSVLAAGMVAVTPVAAQADTAPEVGTPATVTADALPTWSVTGIVWSQAVVGDIVYATGNFTKKRPPGMWTGGPTETAAGNFIAYNIATGERVAAFDHVLNSQGMVVAGSPDGKRVYVGGDFTTIDGVPAGHIAAFDTATGALISTFAPSINGRVRAISATNDTVYVGGEFESANGQARKRLAAFSADTGAMSATWTPQAVDGYVYALQMTPDGSKMVVAGQFLTLNTETVNGWSAVDLATGATLPWPANQVVKDYGKGAMASLTTDGTNIIATGWAYGTGGTFEGSVSTTPDGAINWVADCQGDTYSVYATQQVCYTVSHVHNCSTIGSFPDASPKRSLHALATTNYGTHAITSKDMYGWNFVGQQAPDVLAWYPDLNTGTYSGQGQAAWSVVGNGQYVALGGEFWRVNGSGQQGLTRFAVSSLSLKKQGPRYELPPTQARADQYTTATALSPGKVRVTFDTAWDRDNKTLTYTLVRDGVATSASMTSSLQFWQQSRLGLTDTDAPAGDHRYSVRITDPDGNALVSPVSPVVTVPSSIGAYGQAVLADSPSAYWRLNEPSGTLGNDYTGNGNDLTLAAGVTLGADSATADADTSATFSGTTTGYAYTSTSAPAPTVYSVEAWLKTTSTTGGKIIGYGDRTTGTSSSNDRHVYMDNAGHLIFGVYTGSSKTIVSQATYNDGQWHHVVATQGADGMQLVVDGAVVAHNATVTTAQNFTGYWRVGGDAIGGGWTNSPTSKFIAGTIDDVAVYHAALSLTQIRAHYAASGRTVAQPTQPGDTYGQAVFATGPSLYWRLDETSGTALADASGNNETGVAVGTVTRGQSGITADNAAVSLNGTNGAVAATWASPAPAAYSQQVWFSTTSNKGGKLADFGSAQSGSSASYDRNVQLLSSGAIKFSVNNEAGVLQTTQTYRDGQWHQVIATQDATGMKLYVDGLLVASNTYTAQTTTPGYWRFGGDKVASGSNYYLSGSIDEAAVWNRALTGTEVLSLFTASGRSVPNQLPTAAFTAKTTGRQVAFDPSASVDLDGPIAAYAWDFGDGQTGTGVTATHTYAPGTYQVKLTVTDSAGATATSTETVTIVDLPPSAAFTATVTDLAVSLDASASTDPDGSITAYSWAYGDGTTGTAKQSTHTYAAARTYQVVLTVTGESGVSASVTHDVTVSAANALPTAGLSAASTADFTVAVDGSGSSDSDGSVTGWAWNFGDGATATGVTATHAYAAAGTNTVSLTVTDDRGGKATATKQITVTGPFVTDTFTRTSASGWGSADRGGAWTYNGSTSLFTTTGSAGTIKMAAAGSGPGAFLAASSTDSDVTVAFSLDKAPTGGGTTVTLIGRGTRTDGYRTKIVAQASGNVAVSLTKAVGNAETTIAAANLAGVSFAPNTTYQVRMQTWGVGTTNIRTKVWPAGSPEPATWTLTGTDTTSSLQVAGGIGVMAYLSGSATTAPVVLTVDDIVARPTGN